MPKSLKDLSEENRKKQQVNKQKVASKNRSNIRQDIRNVERGIYTNNQVTYTMYIIVPYDNYQTNFFVFINDDNRYLTNILNNTKYQLTYVHFVADGVSEEIMNFCKLNINAKFDVGDARESNYYETLVYDDIFTKTSIDSATDDNDHHITDTNFDTLYFLTGINNIYSYVRKKTF